MNFKSNFNFRSYNQTKTYASVIKRRCEPTHPFGIPYSEHVISSYFTCFIYSYFKNTNIKDDIEIKHSPYSKHSYSWVSHIKDQEVRNNILKSEGEVCELFSVLAGYDEVAIHVSPYYNTQNSLEEFEEDWIF